MTLSQRLADADLARRVEKDVWSAIKHTMSDLRGHVSVALLKMPEEYRSAIEEFYDDAFKEADNALSDAASDARGGIPSDADIEEDWLDAVDEGRGISRSDS